MQRYVGLVSALLSDSLLVLMAIYAINQRRDALLTCATRFALLEPLAEDRYVRAILSEVFKQSAFGDNAHVAA